MKNGNIMNLVRKDLKLSLHPATIIYFALASMMLFIPNYPRPIGFLYIIIAFMMMFSTDLQNKDREIYDLKQQIVELSMTLDDLTAPAEGKRNGKR